MCCFIFGTQLLAQRKADVVVPFEKKIQSILLNQFTGSVIVKDNDAAYSYNPETNSIEWKVTDKEIAKATVLKDAAETLDFLNNLSSTDYAKLLEAKRDEISFISESPFISLTINEVDAILNSVDGKVVFSSTNIDGRVVQSEYMASEEAFLLMVINKKSYNCIYYDLKSETIKWTGEIAPVESFMKSIGSLLMFKTEYVKDKIVVSDNDIYVTIGGELYRIDKNNGKIIWKTDTKLVNFFLTQSKKNVIIARSGGTILSFKQHLNVLNADTGEKIWKDDITTRFISYLEDWEDRLLVAHAKGFNFYSYADGKKIWKKDAKGSQIKQVITVGDDYLYVSDKEMNLIDKDGQSKWKKFIEICDNDDDEVYYLGKVDNNRVFYLTDTYGNMVDYTTGKKIWKKNIEFDKKRPLLYGYDETKNVFLVYNDKRLYKFDPNAEDKPEYFARLKEINDDKTMSGIELFDWGVSLVGESDAVGVSFDGATIYHNSYKEPGGGSRKFLKVSSTIGRTALGIRAGLRSSFSNASVTVTTRDADGNIVSSTSSLGNNKGADRDEAMISLIDNNVLNKVKQRFMALKQNSEYAFILNKSAAGGAELVKVRKADGHEVDKIELDNNKPMYDIDPVNNILYYVYDNELRVYNQK